MPFASIAPFRRCESQSWRGESEGGDVMMTRVKGGDVDSVNAEPFSFAHAARRQPKTIEKQKQTEKQSLTHTNAPSLDIDYTNAPSLDIDYTFVQHIFDQRCPPLVYHPGFSTSTWPRMHRFKMWKFPLLYRYLVRDAQIVDAAELFYPLASPPEWLTVCHSPQFVESFMSRSITADEQRQIGMPAGVRGDEDRVLLEVGATILASQLATEVGLSCSLAGGTHHAFDDHGSGFTTFNDLAVAAMLAIKHRRASRVLVIDSDVHQGDGTISLLNGKEDIAVLNFYCEKNFPFTKQTVTGDFSENISLPAGTADAEYLSTFKRHVESTLDRFRPDLVLYDAGVDTHKDDELGLLEMTNSGIEERDEFVLDQCCNRLIPIACVIGGGYDEDRERLAARHGIIHRVAARVWQLSAAAAFRKRYEEALGRMSK